MVGVDTVSTPNGTESNALVVADIAHVLWAVDIGCLGLHLWPYRAADPDHADELRIDLDPVEGIGFDEVRLTALRCRDLLRTGPARLPEDHRQPRPARVPAARTRWDSIAVRRPQWRWPATRAAVPDDITANWWKEERGTRVFVDFIRTPPQDRVRSLVRPAPHGGQVSTPLTWDEVETVVPDR